MWVLSKEFKFEASHQLAYHDGKCARLHGHSWRGFVYVSGSSLVEDGAKSGMVMDYADIKKHLNPMVEEYLDHWHLNESLGLPNPTSEIIARWIYEYLRQSLPIIAVRIDETCTSSCFYAPGLANSDILSLAGNAITLG